MVCFTFHITPYYLTAGSWICCRFNHTTHASIRYLSPFDVALFNITHGDLYFSISSRKRQTPNTMNDTSYNALLALNKEESDTGP
jgi:hypothetical protein